VTHRRSEYVAPGISRPGPIAITKTALETFFTEGAALKTAASVFLPALIASYSITAHAQQVIRFSSDATPVHAQLFIANADGTAFVAPLGHAPACHLASPLEIYAELLPVSGVVVGLV
jgi:hypothetical protein